MDAQADTKPGTVDHTHVSGVDMSADMPEEMPPEAEVEMPPVIPSESDIHADQQADGLDFISVLAYIRYELNDFLKSSNLESIKDRTVILISYIESKEMSFKDLSLADLKVGRDNCQRELRSRVIKREVIVDSDDTADDADYTPPVNFQAMEWKTESLAETAKPRRRKSKVTRKIRKPIKKKIKKVKVMKEMENICKICGKSFKHRRNLYAHERGHSGLYPYNCCGTGFSTKKGFQRHRCAEHGESKEFVCQTCNKAFATKDDLSAHEAREVKTRMYSCDICERLCFAKSDLEQHMHTHVTGKHVICPTFGARFKHRSSMYRHQNSVHKTDGLTEIKLEPE